MNSRKRIIKLDGLRGLFSLMLLLFHYRQNMLPDIIYNNFLIRESYLFVDFFFVLSGYVIALNYNKISTFQNCMQYLKRRFFRLYPLLLFTTVVFFLYYLSGNIIANYMSSLFVVEDILVVDIRKKIQAFFDTILLTNSTPILGSSMGMNEPSWSISTEFIAYTLFAFVVLFFNGIFRHISMLIIILISSLYCYQHSHLFPFNGELGFLRGLVSFNLGYFVWYFSDKKISIPNFIEYFIPIILCFLFYILHFNSLDYLISKSVLAIFSVPLFFSLVIYTLLYTNGVISKIMQSNIFQELGKISYSLYLNHFLIVIVLPKLLFKVLNLPHSFIMQIIVFCITLFVAIIYSQFTFKYIEVKFNKR